MYAIPHGKGPSEIVLSLNICYLNIISHIKEKHKGQKNIFKNFNFPIDFLPRIMYNSKVD